MLLPHVLKKYYKMLRHKKGLFRKKKHLSHCTVLHKRWNTFYSFNVFILERAHLVTSKRAPTQYTVSQLLFAVCGKCDLPFSSFHFLLKGLWKESNGWRWRRRKKERGDQRHWPLFRPISQRKDVALYSTWLGGWLTVESERERALTFRLPNAHLGPTAHP